MKTINQNCRHLIRVFLLSILLSMLTGINYAQTNNKQLESNVKKAIYSCYDESFVVKVENRGVVTIEGEVNTLFDKLKIGELISEVEGVQEIKNNISILNDITADDIIKANIEEELKINDAILEPEKIKVEVNNEVVTLSGSVSYFREKVIAQSIASWQDGVIDLISKIKVLPTTIARSDENIKELIGDILKDRFPLEKNVTFAVIDGNVTLNGTVRSLYAKNHIQEEIQHLLGVIGVVNNFSLQKFD